MKKVFIISAKRTAIGSFLGCLSNFSASKLGSLVIQDILKETKLNPDMVDEVIMGNVLSAGMGQAPARQAAIFAGLNESTECLTINKMCGSGLKSIMLAHQAIALGDADIIIAGGMESMSNAPYILPNARKGYKFGHQTIVDSMIKDGLWDVYNDIHMGNCAEACAKEFNLSREEVDAFAINSYKKSIYSIDNGIFENEISPVVIKEKGGDVVIKEDEEPKKVFFDKIATLRPAFDKTGVITAANASKLNDGAAAVLLMSEEKANELGLKPLAEIVAQASFAKAPMQFTTAPADAINKVLKKAGLKKENINVFEINEAFAVVSLAVNKLLGLDDSKVNVNGGAIALGHPIGASGARIMATLVHEMIRKNHTYGLSALCIGGGEASALIIKR